MKNNNENVDILLKKALNSTEKPDTKLIQEVKYKLIKEKSIINMQKSTLKHSFSTVAIIMAVLLLGTSTTLAAWQLLKPSQVVEKFSRNLLSAAFESDTAININESVISGDFIFTLLAVVSGKDLSDTPIYDKNTLHDERTYAVLAIQNIDGTPMPATSDDDYGKYSFFATPLVKGLKPWQVNAATMHGGYSDIVVDGIMYRLAECDDVAIFADRGLYFAVCSSTFYDTNAFIYNEQTGEIKENPNYDRSSAVFNLPIDKSLANPEKAEQYLNSNTNINGTDNDSDNISESDIWEGIDWDKGIPLDYTTKELMVDENGYIKYAYQFEDSHANGKITVSYKEYFTDDKIEQSAIVHQLASGDESGYNEFYAVRFTKDASGIITGTVVMLKNAK